MDSLKDFFYKTNVISFRFTGKCYYLARTLRECVTRATLDRLRIRLTKGCIAAYQVNTL